MRALSHEELNQVAGGTTCSGSYKRSSCKPSYSSCEPKRTYSCEPKRTYSCTPKPVVCEPKPVCQPKPVCPPVELPTE